MIRDFTKANEEHIISIVKDVTAKDTFEKIGDFFGDIGLTISGWFGNLNIENYLGNVDEYHRKILDKKNTTAAEIRRIFDLVREDDTKYGIRQIEIRDLYCDSLKRYLNELILSLDTCKGRIDISSKLQHLRDLRELLKENQLKVSNNPAYSSDYNYYGGRQHGCKIRWENEEDTTFQRQASGIIHKYYPYYTNKEIYEFLVEMKSHGCHYMAVVNTIFAHYIGREDEFEKDFGFPMYDENGHVNSDLVMLDFYARQHKKDHGHSSLGPNEINDQWQDYLKQKHVKVQVNIIDLDINEFDELAENGEIIIVYSPLRLRDKNGNLVDTRRSGHGTVITETEFINGKLMYKVSSWGLEYWIDPDDYKNVIGSTIYEQVIYS